MDAGGKLKGRGGDGKKGRVKKDGVQVGRQKKTREKCKRGEKAAGGGAAADG